MNSKKNNIYCYWVMGDDSPLKQEQCELIYKKIDHHYTHPIQQLKTIEDIAIKLSPQIDFFVNNTTEKYPELFEIKIPTFPEFKKLFDLKLNLDVFHSEKKFLLLNTASFKSAELKIIYNSDFYNAIKSSLETIVMPKLSPEVIKKFFLRQLNHYQIIADIKTVETLLLNINYDLSVVDYLVKHLSYYECNKYPNLSAWLAERLENISGTVSCFTLIDKILARDVVSCINIIQQLRAQSIELTLLLWVLRREIETLITVKFNKSSHKLSAILPTRLVKYNYFLKHSQLKLTDFYALLQQLYIIDLAIKTGENLNLIWDNLTTVCLKII